MKSLSLALLVAASLITTANARSLTQGEKMMSGVISLTACTVYCPALGPIGSTIAASLSMGLVELTGDMKSQLAKSILNDTQDYYQTQTMSPSLSQLVNNLSVKNPNASEAEIIDTLNEFSLNNI